MSEILKKWIGINQVDETIIRLNNNASLRALNQANSADINLLHLNTSNILQLDVSLNAGGFAITNLPTPVNPSDAATMTYVTTTVSGSSANKTLSNLTSPTAINQDLLPASSGTQLLGSATDYWGASYITQLLDTTSVISIDVFGRQLDDTSGNESVDWGGRRLWDSTGAQTSIAWADRQLAATTGTIVLDWSDPTSLVIESAVLNVSGNKIVNVANGTTTNDAVNYGQLENALAGISFRPAVQLFDNVHTTLPTTTATLIDGVTITNGMRVLFVDLSSNNNQVYLATVVVTAVTWAAQDDNGRGTAAPSLGDSIIVLQGTVYGGSQWTYNGTAFVQTNGARTRSSPEVRPWRSPATHSMCCTTTSQSA